MGGCACSLWAGQGLGDGGFGKGFDIRENVLWNDALVQNIFPRSPLPWQKKPSIVWEKAISSKVGFGMWLPASSGAGEGKWELAEGQASHWKREFCWPEKVDTRQRGEDGCKCAEFRRKGDFPISKNYFWLQGEFIQPSAISGWVLYWEDQAGGPVCAAAMVRCGVGLLRSSCCWLCRCWSTRSEAEALLEELAVFRGHSLQLSVAKRSSPTSRCVLLLFSLCQYQWLYWGGEDQMQSVHLLENWFSQPPPQTQTQTQSMVFSKNSSQFCLCQHW